MTQKKHSEVTQLCFGSPRLFPRRAGLWRGWWPGWWRGCGRLCESLRLLLLPRFWLETNFGRAASLPSHCAGLAPVQKRRICSSCCFPNLFCWSLNLRHLLFALSASWVISLACATHLRIPGLWLPLAVHPSRFSSWSSSGSDCPPLETPHTAGASCCRSSCSPGAPGKPLPSPDTPSAMTTLRRAGQRHLPSCDRTADSRLSFQVVFSQVPLCLAYCSSLLPVASFPARP